jgi:AAA domain
MGKSSAIRPLAAAWREQGRDVWGASLAWRQADDLALARTNWSEGIDKRNVKAFSVMMDAIEAGDIKLSRRSVLVIDEFGMLGTRSGLRLLRAQEKHGFSVVALGDEKQVQSIEAGPLVDLARRALGRKNVPEILTSKRQKTERERDIVGLLRNGEAAKALDMKREDGTAEMVPGGRAAVIDRVAKLYAERLAATGQAPGINAPTNQDAHDISAAVRLERRARGLVGADVWSVKATDGTREYTLPLAPGDHVRLFKSTGANYGDGTGGPIGRNGTVLEVLNADADGITLKNENGRVGVVTWDKLAHGDRTRLAYGDAMTINTAQGSSSGEQITAFPDGTDRVVGQQAYSALTRHFYASLLVTSDQAERIAVQKRRPINDTREISTADKWANVARSFAHQPEKDSAIALSGRVRKLRQGGIQVFQKALLPAQPGQRVSNASSQAPGVAQRQKIAVGQAMMQVIQRGVDQTVDVYRQVAHKVVQRVRPAIQQAPRPEHHRPRVRM